MIAGTHAVVPEQCEDVLLRDVKVDAFHGVHERRLLPARSGLAVQLGQLAHADPDGSGLRRVGLQAGDLAVRDMVVAVVRPRAGVAAAALLGLGLLAVVVVEDQGDVEHGVEQQHAKGPAHLCCVAQTLRQLWAQDAGDCGGGLTCGLCSPTKVPKSSASERWKRMWHCGMI